MGEHQCFPNGATNPLTAWPPGFALNNTVFRPPPTKCWIQVLCPVGRVLVLSQWAKNTQTACPPGFAPNNTAFHYPPPKYWIQVLAQTRRAGCFCGCAGPSGRSRAQPMGWGPPRGPCGGPDLRAPNAAASTVPPRVLQVCAAPRPVGPGPTMRTQRVASNPCPGPCKPLRP